jgi:hypothetical protein
VPLANLGLPASGEFLAFDFWRRTFLGTLSGSVDVPELELGCCQVIGLRPRLNRPQLLGTSRHVSMGAVSVDEQAWEDNMLTLTLKGIPDTTETYWFHSPDGWRVESTQTDGATVAEQASDGETLSLSVSFRSPQATLAIRWTEGTD